MISLQKFLGINTPKPVKEIEESQQELWNQLSRHRGLVGGTVVRYERGVEVLRDAIYGSRIIGGFSPSITIIGKRKGKVSFGLDCSRIKKVEGRYEIHCQPDGFNTFEFAIAPGGIEIPRRDY